MKVPYGNQSYPLITQILCNKEEFIKDMRHHRWGFLAMLARASHAILEYLYLTFIDEPLSIASGGISK